ncbi:hypothetical protein ACS0TY_025051 [Phlomoides rotata]
MIIRSTPMAKKMVLSATGNRKNGARMASSSFARETNSMRLHFAKYSSTGNEDEDKRHVPTGSNPLHNR